LAAQVSTASIISSGALTVKSESLPGDSRRESCRSDGGPALGRLLLISSPLSPGARPGGDGDGVDPAWISDGTDASWQ
jgi:hypothetical protein